jgi:hypothetical protein
MAKKRSGVNKSAAIREVLRQHPTMKVSEIVATLARKHITVKPQLVYFIKGTLKGKAVRATRRHAVARPNKVGMTNPIELLVDLKKLAERAGGMRNLIQLAEVLAD